jgi:putative hydrolase of HD superfamily
MNFEKICDYIFELNALKKFDHSGTKLAGVPNPDTIAEHAYRAAVIGYILAKAEKANPEKTALICLMHDNAEARITDLHKVARRYIDTKKPEKTAYKEQLENLPDDFAKELLANFLEFENRTTAEGIIAKDADMLETAFQAKEYLDTGHKACQDWIDNVEKCVRTKTAKKIIQSMKKKQFTDWFRGKKRLDIPY